MTPRRVVYTCLFGGYETLLDQPVAGDSEVEFVAFTDDAGVASDSWQVRLVPAPFPADQNRSSRRPKILAHDYLPEFDESLYIDNTVLLTAPPERAFDALLPPDAPMALMAHSYRGPVREEFAAVVSAGRDIDIVCDEQIAHYGRVAPEVLDRQTMWGGFLLRRHHDPALRAAMQTWWEHVLRYSRRDQLSLPFALTQSGLPHRVHELDNRVSEYHVWPRSGTERDPSGGASADIAAGLRAHIATALAETVGQRTRVERAEGEAARARTELAEVRPRAEGEAARARTELAEVRRRLDATVAAVAAVHDSTSWRVTRPLRALSRLGRLASVARRADGRGRR